MIPSQITESFRHHNPTPKQVEAFNGVEEAITNVTIKIAGLIPPSRERSLFITKMQEAKMWANTGLAVHGIAGAHLERE